MRQKLAELIDIIYGFRKFIAFLLLFGIAILFRFKDLVDGAQWVDLMKAVSYAFFAANGIEHFTEAAKSYYNSQSPGSVPLTQSMPPRPTSPNVLPPPSEEP